MEFFFISNLPCDINNVFRRIEKNNKKLINCRSSVLFNNACIKNKIQPKYTNLINIYSRFYKLINLKRYRASSISLNFTMKFTSVIVNQKN